VGDRSVIGQIFFVKIVLFRRGMIEESLNCLGKTPVLRERLTISVIVGRSIGRHYLRIDVGIGSRSQKVLDDLHMSLESSSLDTGMKTARLAGM